MESLNLIGARLVHRRQYVTSGAVILENEETKDDIIEYIFDTGAPVNAQCAYRSRGGHYVFVPHRLTWPQRCNSWRA